MAACLVGARLIRPHGENLGEAATSGGCDADTGIVRSLKAMPADVLAAVFGGTAEQFEQLPGERGRVVIASKQENRPASP